MTSPEATPEAVEAPQVAAPRRKNRAALRGFAADVAPKLFITSRRLGQRPLARDFDRLAGKGTLFAALLIIAALLPLT